MIFAHKTRIEEYMIELLDNGSMNGPNILTSLQHQFNKKITKQAVYKSLRKLVDEEVVNKTGTQYSLNRVWLQKIQAFSKRHIEHHSSIDTMNILDLEDGDSVTYQFKNPFTLDITWGHLYDIIFEANEKYWVMLNHHPHEWMMLSRPDTERFWLNQINKKQKTMLFTLSGKTPLDKQFQKEWASEYIKINIGKSYGLQPNQYLSVVGDYIFEITTDLEFEKRINEFFNSHNYINEIAQKQINAISKQKYKSKLKLSKNKKKADFWRKKYKKDFYIPKPYYLFHEN